MKMVGIGIGIGIGIGTQARVDCDPDSDSDSDIRYSCLLLYFRSSLSCVRGAPGDASKWQSADADLVLRFVIVIVIVIGISRTLKADHDHDHDNRGSRYLRNRFDMIHLSRDYHLVLP